MTRRLPRIPISRWYVRSVLIGSIGGVLLFWVAFFLPVGAGTKVAYYFISVHLVDDTGAPFHGAVYGERDGQLLQKRDRIGITDQEGRLHAVRCVYHSVPIHLVARPAPRHLEVKFTLYIQDPEDSKKVATIQGSPVPEHVRKVIPSYPRWCQFDTFPSWASEASILHATIEP